MGGKEQQTFVSILIFFSKAQESKLLAETSKKKFLTTHTGLAGKGQLTSKLVIT